jgi:membrane associated rhomboid family serine protease
LIGLWFLTQLISVGTIAQSQGGGVAYVAHIAGFIFGAAFARVFERPSDGSPPY